MSQPAPGIAPTKVPIAADFTVVQAHRTASTRRTHHPCGCAAGAPVSAPGSASRSASDTANSPINAGMNEIPSIRLTAPKMYRG